LNTVGLLGGMSWQSTELYYRAINEYVADVLGGLHSARIALRSVDFHDIVSLTDHNEWDAAARLLIQEACLLKAAGADFILICSNTMHRVATQVEREAGVPVLSIIKVASEWLSAHRFRRVGLLGTRFVTEGFYRSELDRTEGMTVLVPDEADRIFVHDTIYSELARGGATVETRERFRRIVCGLTDRGAEAVLLGCTELPLVIAPGDHPLPIASSTQLHAEAAARLVIRDCPERRNHSHE
jgi:aspartate racemase